MHVDLLFPSKYLKCADLHGEDLVIELRKLETKHELKRAGGAVDRKPVFRTDVVIAGESKMWTLNKTNSQTIASMHGPETDNWNGKKITLFPDTTKFAGKTVPCIRVREVVPKQKQPPADPVEGEPAHDPGTGEVMNPVLAKGLKIIKDSNPELNGVADQLRDLELKGEDHERVKAAYLAKLQAGG